MSRTGRRGFLRWVALSLGALCVVPVGQAEEILVFELTRTSVERVDLGAEEPDQGLALVTVWLTDTGAAALIRLTTDNVGRGLVIALPGGRRFGPNRIEKPATGRKLGMVLPSDAARALAAAINKM